ncbi:E3 ubiquitin-protein ligase BRE1-like 2 [Iris pallida]|uniref:E3 ubiquitin-protein ligase BRE1-like 2 n=1 Tax=Iris pallida TaxID=29817 RepID=A0AAX6F549_IRIPA|nr:E3 ubiquitin-protein ligase BRE1-like 2 [Iris pallida]
MVAIPRFPFYGTLLLMRKESRGEARTWCSAATRTRSMSPNRAPLKQRLLLTGDCDWSPRKQGRYHPQTLYYPF